jgi:hypothetical protein
MSAYWVDIAAVGFFVVEWLIYGITLEHTAYGRDSLSARMNGYREVWVRNMLDREARMVDMQIMASLQNGTAFFASTSLIAIGGGLALLRATNDALAVLRELPVDLTPSPALWEIKCVGLILIFIYAFFKFVRVLQIRLVLPPVQLCRDPARRDAAIVTARHGRRGGPCDTHDAIVRGRRPAFQPRPARVLLRARLPRLVRQSMGIAADDGARRHRDLAAAVRLERLAGDGVLAHFDDAGFSDGRPGQQEGGAKRDQHKTRPVRFKLKSASRTCRFQGVAGLLAAKSPSTA